MPLEDIRASVPAKMLPLIQEDEKVFFYGSGTGCLGMGSSYIFVTNERVVGSAIKPGGCLGGSSAGTVSIPLEHVSSVQTSKVGGCLGIGGGQTVVVSSGTASNAFSTTDAQKAAGIIQQAMREAKR